MSRILVIDDDPALVRALRIALSRSDYDVVSATTGEQGISAAALSNPDVIVLDLGLPDLDGVGVCRRIRDWSDVPIIVLSAANAEARKVAALDEGANDYVTKPFGMAELEARIRAALRHHRPKTEPEPSELVAGPLVLDLVHHEARADHNPIKLTSREFDLLAFLVRHAGKICTHQMILDSVWGNAYSNERQYLHSYLHRLRQKLRSVESIRIETTPGIGYVLHVTDGDHQDQE